MAGSSRNPACLEHQLLETSVVGSQRIDRRDLVDPRVLQGALNQPSPSQVRPENRIGCLTEPSTDGLLEFLRRLETLHLTVATTCDQMIQRVPVRQVTPREGT